MLAIVAVPKAQPLDTDADLRATVNGFLDIWNRHDMTQFADTFTPDAHLVNVIAIYLDGMIIGSVCGMFVVAPLVALLAWNAPMAGGVVGFGVLGTAVGLVVALMSRVLIAVRRRSKQTLPPGCSTV